LAVVVAARLGVAARRFEAFFAFLAPPRFAADVRVPAERLAVDLRVPAERLAVDLRVPARFRADFAAERDRDAPAAPPRRADFDLAITESFRAAPTTVAAAAAASART
jgi:hypothetical protein